MLYLISSLHWELIYTILLMHVSWILLKFNSGIFRLFCNAKNRKFRQNVVTASAESFFTVYGKMFSSCICNSTTDLLQFHETVLWYWVRKSIGCAIPSDFAVIKNLFLGSCPFVRPSSSVCNVSASYEPRCEKTGLRGFWPGPTQTGLYCHRRWLEAWNFGFR